MTKAFFLSASHSGACERASVTSAAHGGSCPSRARAVDLRLVTTIRCMILGKSLNLCVPIGLICKL